MGCYSKTKQIEEFAATELQGVTVCRLVYEGDPESQIAGFAQDVQLVVRPTHGYGWFRKIPDRFGRSEGAARRLVSSADRRAHGREGVFVEGELFNDCVRDRSKSARSGHTGAGFQIRTRFGGQAQCRSCGAFDKRRTYITFSSQVKQEMEQIAREEVRRLQAEAGASVSICIREGDIAREVCLFAQSIAADMLTIGRGDQCAATGRLRTNAYSIIRQAPCPVLSV